MDLATLVGLLGGFAIVVFAMVLGGSLGMFVDVPSILIVIVGSLLVCMMKFSLGQFLGATKTVAKAFMFKLDSPEELIANVKELADEARKGGLLALEGKEISNDFLKRGIGLLIDGHEADVVRNLLVKDKNQAVDRHKVGSRVWEALGDVAPAMGMIGTLIGLVAMLSNMDDPKSIGPAMAVALLTTLYGAMLANMVAIPFADKLKLRMAEESLIKSMSIDAIMAIQAGQNPRVIEMMLRNYLSEGSRETQEE
ncbi:flagellar motor protein PomA [Oleiphilus sp. HI0071]|nr:MULTISPECIES: flagellar motor protein PomA [unclassified Oleiphilus]KZY60214.1 flagellar motor protein PomA [Oleiphilus sp. HI0065]KZY82526.1 flagellar motor protein PomA [Oleiphilus sp. HI0071]KZY92865.1 flagellar motor protein PomA [Oleiphilus sp. HI0073]KZZ44769.1 flagellar motor protein PomA [Oleiphilus sp. HI0118]KZZ50681.1 flagellar motor protein PomA [Oleiphilus sp. HI0122]KZZ74416.1 flagellar motor protein PomA [Oleiphilus sp. HI0130]KZZ78821.1 flagellar motor protein PomA [Oleiph